MNKHYITLCLCFALSGCALAPGMRTSDIGKHQISETASTTTSGTLGTSGTSGTSGKVPTTSVATIIPITPQTIMRLIREGQRGAAVEPPPAEPHIPYRIGKRDILSIMVWDHPELVTINSTKTSGTVVGEDGNIFYPYIGIVYVAGMTLPKLRTALTRRLAKYITKPQLAVTVADYRSQKAYVVGAVTKPGVQPITDVPLTVAEAINRAGGIIIRAGNSEGGTTTDADMQHVTLARAGKIYNINLLALYEQGDLRQNIELRDGDVLSVPDSSVNKVFVLGEVKNPRSQFIHKGRLTLAESLSDAGGVDQLSSDPSRIYVIRHGVKKPEIFHFDGQYPDALVLADRFPLRPRDVVYVGTAGITSWNRVISQIVPIASLLFQASLFNNSLTQ